jgi:hypothetical protein
MAPGLEHAITLARAKRCHLVILCSRDTGDHRTLGDDRADPESCREIGERHSQWIQAIDDTM